MNVPFNTRATRILRSGWGALAFGSIAVSTLIACESTLDGGSAGENRDDIDERESLRSDDVPSPSTRFRRLTHREWERTSVNLLGVENGSALHDYIVETAADFRADPRQGGFIFDGAGEALEVDSTLWSAYQRAAGRIALEVVSDAELFDALPQEGDTDEARAKDFIKRFGALAHRRPLTSAQEDEYFQLYGAGVNAYPDTSGFRGGVRVLLEAFLQSPYFLYRVESSTEVVDGVVPLDAYERASRLSYLFWGTMPDAELMSAAEDNKLDTDAEVREQAERLVADPRARDTVVNFFEKVLEVERYERIAPSQAAFPDAPDTLAESARTETSLFIQNEIYKKAGSLRDLLTSTTTYVDSDLAEIYDLTGTFDETFEEVSLPSEERAGVFTQIGFLATNSTTTDPDPIHRGVFLARRVNCLTLAAPPDAVPPLPVPDGQSNRQLVEEHTQAEGTTCRNCHLGVINPYGFAYEHYDATGAFRTKDRNHDVNSVTEVIIDDGTSTVADAVELAQAMAGSRNVHECFSEHLVSFSQGRRATADDRALIAILGDASLDDALSFREMMVEVSVAVSFLNRTPEAE